MIDVRLRAIQPDDEPFLRELYHSVRAEEVAAWGWDATLARAFLDQQFAARRQQQTALGGQRDARIVLDGERPIGMLATVVGAGAIELHEIELLPAYRNRGIGTRLIRAELAAAARAGKPMALRALKTNPAVRLYLRLGFRQLDDDGVYLSMQS